MKDRTSFFAVCLFSLAVVLALAGCGSGPSTSPSPVPTIPPTKQSIATATPAITDTPVPTSTPELPSIKVEGADSSHGLSQEVPNTWQEKPGKPAKYQISFAGDCEPRTCQYSGGHTLSVSTCRVVVTITDITTKSTIANQQFSGSSQGCPEKRAFSSTWEFVDSDPSPKEFSKWLHSIFQTSSSGALIVPQGMTPTPTPVLRMVTVVFNITVPPGTDAAGRSVYIAGTLDLLDGGLPNWDPGGVQLTRVNSTHWTITLTGKEDTIIEYKYTLGDWDHVEKNDKCGEILNRGYLMSFGSSGSHTAVDHVLKWRNTDPCGN